MSGQRPAPEGSLRAQAIKGFATRLSEAIETGGDQGRQDFLSAMERVAAHLRGDTEFELQSSRLSWWKTWNRLMRRPEGTTEFYFYEGVTRIVVKTEWDDGHGIQVRRIGLNRGASPLAKAIWEIIR